MDVINVHEHLIMGGKKKKHIIQSSQRIIARIWDTMLELQGKQFTFQSKRFKYVHLLLWFWNIFWIYSAFCVGTRTFNIFWLDFSTSWLPGQEGSGTQKSLAAGYKEPHDKSLSNQNEQVQGIPAVYLQWKSACWMPLCSSAANP